MALRDTTTEKPGLVKHAEYNFWINWTTKSMGSEFTSRNAKGDMLFKSTTDLPDVFRGTILIHEPLELKTLGHTVLRHRVVVKLTVPPARTSVPSIGWHSENMPQRDDVIEMYFGEPEMQYCVDRAP